MSATKRVLLFLYFFSIVQCVYATTYTVTTTADAGAGSLREAITNANTNPGADIIIFTTSGTLVLASVLPDLTDDAGVTINGNTAPGYAENTNLTGALNGTLTFTIDGDNINSIGIAISSDNNIIRALNFINLPNTGIAGVVIEIKPGADNNQILGCYIGTEVTGTTSAGVFTDYGIEITNGANNKVGDGSAAGRNLISGLKLTGLGAIFIQGASATGNIIKGNIIGLQKDGATCLTTTQGNGVRIGNDAGSTTIGGTLAGEGNVISGNGSSGIYFTSAAAAGNTVLGNIIGPQANGTSSVVSNTQNFGVRINCSNNNAIGGGMPEARNIISANLISGIYIEASGILGATGNSVKGNYIGLDITGTIFIPGSSQDDGVNITSLATGNTIGGSLAGEGNVISGNSSRGIYCDVNDVAGNTILGNIIGPQADGISNVLSNAQNRGIFISDSPNNIIGNTGALEKNIISANLIAGVVITGAGSTGNLVKGNYIGPGSSLATITGTSQDYGVRIQNSAADNTLGGSAAGEANQIAFNTVEGVFLTSTASTGNLISRNPIYTNTGKPINLNYGASQANNGKVVPIITTASTTTVIGTSVAGDIVEVFKNPSSNCNNAVTFVGSATADGSGNWSLAAALTAGEYALATATDASNNTSEFTTCVVLLPVEFLYFNAAAANNRKVKCTWATATEMNNNYFAIERAAGSTLWSSSGSLPAGQADLQWEQIGTVKGAGNSSSTLQYEFIDETPLSSSPSQSPEQSGEQGDRRVRDEVYYRLRQVDYDGQFAYSPIRKVHLSTWEPISVYPTLSSGDFTIYFSEKKWKQVLLVICNALGQKFYSKEFIIDNDLFIETVNLSGKLAPGVYAVITFIDGRFLGKRIVIK